MIKIIQKKTPNFSEGPWVKGRPARVVRGIVIHIMEGTERGTDQHFASDASDVSSELAIGLDGEVRQYVSIHDIAWHAGRVQNATWPGLLPGNPNNYLIGLEHEGYGKTPWPEAQLQASAMMSWWLCYRFKLPVVPLTFPLHREIFSGKTCPGPAFKRDQYVERVRAIQTLIGPDITKLVEGLR